MRDRQGRGTVWSGALVASCAAGALAQPCASWTQVSVPGPLPAARAEHRLAYDEARRKVVMYGGYDGAAFLGDTWEYDPASNTWEQKFPVNAPSPRVEFGMTYDPVRRKTVLFSGANNAPMGGHHLPGLWEWDGVNWQFFDPPGPSARHGHATCFDSARNVFVLSFSKHGEEDTWEYSPAPTGPGAWALRQNFFPPTRAFNAMDYDASRAVTVAFGGYDARKMAPAFTVYRETLEWDGVQWTLRAPVNQPSGRYATSGVYDATRRRFTLIAGYTGATLLNDAWAWDGGDWTPIAAPGLPARQHHGLCFDSLRGRVILYAGSGPSGELGDLWELRFDPEFTLQPESLTVTKGFEARLEADAATQGAGPLGFQWTKDEIEIVGATAPTLVIPEAEPGDAGVYVCRVSGSCGLIYSRAATLTVLGPCPGDANGDRVVNFADLNLVLSAYGQSGAPGSIPGDVNRDGVVNFEDLNIVLSAFGVMC